MVSRVYLDELDRQVLAPASETEPRNMGADLAELSDGRLLLAYSRWLGGTHDYDRSQICGLLSEDGGATWGRPFDIAVPDAHVEAVRMPCFLRLRSGQLACFARYRSTVLDTWVGMAVCGDESELGRAAPTGESSVAPWSAPVRVTPPPPGRHILLNNRAVRLQRGPAAGRILLPLASPWPWDEEDARGSDIRSWVLRSDDDGQSWQASDTMLSGPKRGLMEPYITELPDGRLRLWMRTQMDCQYESVSVDGGIAWNEAAPGPLVSPESPVAVARHPGSRLLMVVWNHSRVGRHTADRTPLTVAFSDDEGESWFGEQRLDPGPDDPPAERTFSYPSAHFLGDRGFVTYYERLDGRISLVLRRFVLRVG
ncbi:MAG: sialidase family protein [Gemmatimonadota bacterium]